jgi:hypothetical protein
MDTSSWQEIGNDFRQGAEAFPDVRAYWEAKEDLWTLQNARNDEVPVTADSKAQSLFAETARAAVRRRGIPLDEKPPWHIWLDLLRKSKRGFGRIKVARTFSVFQMAAEGKGIPDPSGIRLLDDGAIWDVFRVSADFCEDLAFVVAGEASARAAVDAFILKCEQAISPKVNRKHIWRAAGHTTARQFQFWQASDPKATVQDAQNFRRILAMNPTDFEALLKKKCII